MEQQAQQVSPVRWSAEDSLGSESASASSSPAYSIDSKRQRIAQYAGNIERAMLHALEVLAHAAETDWQRVELLRRLVEALTNIVATVTLSNHEGSRPSPANAAGGESQAVVQGLEPEAADTRRLAQTWESQPGLAGVAAVSVMDWIDRSGSDLRLIQAQSVINLLKDDALRNDFTK